MKHFLLFYSTLIISTSAFAQKAIIKGRVLSETESNSFSNVAVVINGTIKKNTDTKGMFQFNDMPIGDHTLSAVFLGYEKKEIVISIALENEIINVPDIKLKENITDATPKLDKLMQVRVVNFNLKTDPNIKQIGVIAQELQEVFPGLVEENYDRDSDNKLNGETTLGVKYSVFVPMLIKAIQELTARVQYLENK